MDPITVTHLVQDRTHDLQRIAEQVRQERSLRSTRGGGRGRDRPRSGPPASRPPREPRARRAGAARARPPRCDPRRDRAA